MTQRVSSLFNVFTSLLLLVALFGCDKISEEPKRNKFVPSIAMQTITIFDNMNISIPDNYEQNQSESKNIVYKNNESSIIISAQDTNPEYNTADAYSFYALTEYTKLFDEFSVTNETVYNLENTDAYIKEFTYKIYGDNSTLEMNCLTGFIVYGSKTYVITCSASPDNYENDKTGFSETIKSISFNTSETEKSAETSSVSTD